MKKQIFSIALSCVLALSTVFSMATFSFAAENVVKYTDAAGKEVYDTDLSSAIEKAPSGATITLLKDITLTTTSNADSRYSLVIQKDITIDGQGTYFIDCSNTQRGIAVKGSSDSTDHNEVFFTNITIKNSSVIGRSIDTRGGYLDLNILNSTIKTTGAGNTQALTIGGSHSELTKVNITNSNLSTGNAGYGIITFNPVDMTIDNSSVSGYAALYIKGVNFSAGSAGSKIVVKNNSTLSGVNPHTLESNSSFGTIMVETSDISIDIVDSLVQAETTNTAKQRLVSFSTYENPHDLNDKIANNKVTIKGNSKLEVIGGNAEFVTENNQENFVKIEAGEANFEPESKYISKDKVAIELRMADFEKYYIGTEKEINTVLADAPNGAKVTVLQGEASLNIPEAGVEVFNKGDGKVTVNGVNVEPNNDKPVITGKEDPAAPQTPDKDNPTDKEPTPNTGDSNSALFLFISLFTATALAALVLTALRRKHN